MTPKSQSNGNLRSLVYFDTEDYVWLAAEFFEGNERTATAIPLMRSHPSSSGGNLFDLAGEFSCRTSRPRRHTTPRHSAGGRGRSTVVLSSLHTSFDQKMNTGKIPEANFNPQFSSR